MATAQRWIALESNPKVLNKYVHNLGMDAKWNFVDVFGLDPDLLTLVPQPVAAVLLLFPNPKTANQELIGDIVKDIPSELYFIKQTIGNACGTVAIVHALSNNPEIPFDDSLHFKTFLEKTKFLSPDERAQHLKQDNKMGAAHEDCAQEGDTQTPSQDEHVDSHFVALVSVCGTLYELGKSYVTSNADLPFIPSDLIRIPIVQMEERMGQFNTERHRLKLYFRIVQR